MLIIKVGRKESVEYPKCDDKHNGEYEATNWEKNVECHGSKIILLREKNDLKRIQQQDSIHTDQPKCKLSAEHYFIWNNNFFTNVVVLNKDRYFETIFPDLFTSTL